MLKIYQAINHHRKKNKKKVLIRQRKLNLRKRIQCKVMSIVNHWTILTITIQNRESQYSNKHQNKTQALILLHHHKLVQNQKASFNLYKMNMDLEREAKSQKWML